MTRSPLVLAGVAALMGAAGVALAAAGVHANGGELAQRGALFLLLHACAALAIAAHARIATASAARACDCRLRHGGGRDPVFGRARNACLHWRAHFSLRRSARRHDHDPVLAGAGGGFCDREPAGGLIPACGTSREFVSFARVDGLVARRLAFLSALMDCASERLQEDSMQAKLKRGKAAFHTRSAGSSVAILAGASLIAALALCAPDQALAACGGASHPAGVHAAAERRRRRSRRDQAPQRRQAVAAGRKPRMCRLESTPRRCAACQSPARAGWSRRAPTRRARRVTRGPPPRGPRTPARICTPLGLRIAPDDGRSGH